MTVAEIELLKQVGQVPIAHYTITGAEDWPMFLAMIKLVGVISACSFSAIVGLIIYTWNDLKKSLVAQRDEDAARCGDCSQKIWEHISGPVWNAIEGCCPRMPKADKESLRDEIRRQTEGGA